jgi:hypothetical protein
MIQAAPSVPLRSSSGASALSSRDRDRVKAKKRGASETILKGRKLEFEKAVIRAFSAGEMGMDDRGRGGRD